MSTEWAARRPRGRGHELRPLIVEKTVELLAELGDVDALTMRAVAQAAEVTPPSVYRHFEDKAALVREVLAESFDEFRTVLSNAASSPTPFDRLTAMAHAYVDFGLRRVGPYRLIFSTRNAGNDSIGLNSTDRHPGSAALTLLRQIVGDCLPHADTQQVANAAAGLWCALHGYVELRTSKPDLDLPEPHAIVNLALNAVTSETER